MNENSITIDSMVISIPCAFLIECLKLTDATPEKWEALGILGDHTKGEEMFQIETVLNNSTKTVQLTLLGSNIIVSKKSTELKITSVHRLESNVIQIPPLKPSENPSNCDLQLETIVKCKTLVEDDKPDPNVKIPTNKPKAKRTRKPKQKPLPVVPENEENLNINEGNGGRRKYGLRGVKLSSAIMDAVKCKDYSDDSDTDVEMDLDETEDYVDQTDEIAKLEDETDETSLKRNAEAQTDYDVEDSVQQAPHTESRPKKQDLPGGASYTRYLKKKYKGKCNLKRSLKILKKFKNSSLAKDQSVDKKKILSALEDVYSSNRRRKCSAKSATCKYCEKKYCDFSGVDIHVRKFHMKEKDVTEYLEELVPLKQMTCSICNVTLPNRLQLQVHEDRDHSKVLSQCAICGKVFRNLQFLRNHIKIIHLCDETHLCHLCSATFKHAMTLKQHIEEIHEQQRNVSCSVCGKAFYRQAQLNRHSRIHDTNGKKLICQICGKEFNYECNLQRHVRVVHAPKSENFHCSYCGKGFYQKGTMSAHIQKIHFNLFPFFCEICKSSFMRSKHVEDHMSQVHSVPDFKVANPREKLLKYNRSGTDLFSCSYCQETFSYKSSLVDHIQTSHADVFPFRCDLCQQGFLERVFLVRHQEKAHDIAPRGWPDDDQQLLEVHLSSNTKQVTIVPLHDGTMTEVEGRRLDETDARDDVLNVLSSSMGGAEHISVRQEEEIATGAGSVLVEISNDDNTIRYVIQGGEGIDMDSSNTVVHDIASLLLAAEQSLQENSEMLALEDVDESVVKGPETEGEGIETPGVITLANTGGSNVAVCRIDDDAGNINPSSIGMEEITVIMQE